MAWRVMGVCIVGERIEIGGLNVWDHQWREIAGEGKLPLSHPSYPNQQHQYAVYNIGDVRGPVTFAAAELSPAVYGLYVPE